VLLPNPKTAEPHDHTTNLGAAAGAKKGFQASCSAAKSGRQKHSRRDETRVDDREKAENTR